MTHLQSTVVQLTLVDTGNTYAVAVAHTHDSLLLINNDGKLISRAKLNTTISHIFMLNISRVILYDTQNTIYSYNLRAHELKAHKKVHACAYNDRLNDTSLLLCSNETFTVYNIYTDEVELTKNVLPHREPAIISSYQFALMHESSIEVWDIRTKSVTHSIALTSAFRLWSSTVYYHTLFAHVTDFIFCAMDSNMLTLFDLESKTILYQEKLSNFLADRCTLTIVDHFFVFVQSARLKGDIKIKTFDLENKLARRAIRVNMCSADTHFVGNTVLTRTFCGIESTSVVTGQTETMLKMEKGGLTHSMILDEERILVGTENKRMYVIDFNSGEKRDVPFIYWTYCISTELKRKWTNWRESKYIHALAKEIRFVDLVIKTV